MSELSNQSLPLGWAQAQLQEIVEPRSGKAHPQATPDTPFIGLENVEPQTTRLLGTVPCASMKSAGNVFHANDVLYSRLRAYLNKVCQPDFSGLCSGEFIVMPESESISGRFLKYRLNASDFVRFASQLNTGDRPRVDFDQIKVFEAILPPRNEQERIADTLDELLTDLDDGVASLERVRAKLALYRASVLKAAVDGSLTAEWRKQHPNVEPASELLKRILTERRRHWEEEQLRRFKDKGQEPPKNWKAKYKEPVAPNQGQLPALSNDWCWAALSQLGNVDRGKSKHRPRDAAFLYGGPYPFIQTGDVRRARQFVREHTQTYSESGLKQSRLWAADTLCITIAANIAETAILSYPACFPDSIVGVQVDGSLVSTRYVELFIRAAKTRITAYAPATAQKNINNEILRALAVPLPPFEEQNAIVEATEGQLSIVDHVCDDLVLKLNAAKAMRQSILRDAFTGQLVPQNPNDEPASELLKRIAAEREQRARHAGTARRTKAATKKPRTQPRGRTKKKAVAEA